MSDASYDDLVQQTPGYQTTTNGASSTQLGAFASDMDMDMADPLQSSVGGGGDMETLQQQEGLSIQQKMQEINMNQVASAGLVTLISMVVLVKLAVIDPASIGSMTRGWTMEESAQQAVSSIWNSYTTVLRDSPITTKAVTSATVYTIGDVLAQRAELGDESESLMSELDKGRMVRSMLAGLIGHGPLSHYWYQFSENLFNNVLHLTQWWSFIPKVVVDQTLWGPIWNNSYIVLLGLMKFEKPTTIWSDMKRTTIPLMLSGLKLWPLAHCVTYGLIPVENRLLWVDFVEIFWVTILASQAAGLAEDVTEDKAVVAVPVAEAPALVVETN